MKKILLLIVSGLLIACMAGSAMAATISIPGLDPNLPHVVRINPSGGVTTVSLDYAGFDANILHTAEVEPTCNVQGGVLTACISGLPGGAATAWASTNTKAAVDYTPTSSTYGATLEIEGTDAGIIYIRDFTQGITYPVQVYVKAEIPEFPTVALPVAAILGLVFIFGRRKEGL